MTLRFLPGNLYRSLLILALAGSLTAQDPNADKDESIKAYCLDFNWGHGRRAGFAKPGSWKEADPAKHVEWHKAIGANVIQTFAVSCNGYAWYESDAIPKQPGLKHDFLTEMVKLGHANGMKVMGYFCIAANTRWGKENPEFSYGTPSGYHIPYTDKYLAYLSAAITDAIKTTGIDGFMIDWVWMPQRKSTNGKWTEAEKKLYQQLMGDPFPGEDKLTKDQELAYGKKAINRCWKTIHKAAKTADPNNIIWLTTNKVNHPLVKDSEMYQEVDWFMGESGKLEEILKIKPLVGKHTKLMTCFSDFGGGNAIKDIPEAIEAGIGLYGYAKPNNTGGTIDLEKIFPMQFSQISGNSKRIAVLARAYRGLSMDTVWKEGRFVEPENPLPFHIELKSRRGFSDFARTEVEDGNALISINTPYQGGRALLTRKGKQWPSSIEVRFAIKHPTRPHVTEFRVANGKIGASIEQKNGKIHTIAGETNESLNLKSFWKKENFLNEGSPEKSLKLNAVTANTTEESVTFTIPMELTKGNPEAICFEWGYDGKIR